MDVIEPVKDETLKDCSVSSADEINLEKKAKKRKKETKKGVIYISTIPPLMTVARIREIFMHYGEVGRIFLQPNSK